MRRHPLVVLINQTTVLDDQAVAVCCHALQHQVAYHFQPHWNAGATLTRLDRDTPIPDDAWALILADDSDQAGALGYHEVTHSGQPVGFVFAKTDMDNGLSWTVTASHELLEMLADPYAANTVQVGNATFVALEVCDAVEADDLGYNISGVQVSDFMLPSWFVPDLPADRYDFRHHCTRPLQILPGGYIGAWTPQGGWQQATHGQARHEAGPRFRRRIGRNRAERFVTTR